MVYSLEIKFDVMIENAKRVAKIECGSIVVFAAFRYDFYELFT